MKLDKGLIEQINQGVMKINEKNPYYLLIGLLVAILIIDYIAVMQFQLRTLSSLNPKIKSLSEEVTSTKNHIQRLAQYQTEIKRLNEKLNRFTLLVRGREEIPRALENVSIVANKNGVMIQQIMPDTNLGEPALKTKEGRYYVIPISLEAKSGYHNFGRFLNQLEAEGVFLNIADFSIASNPKDIRPHNIKLTIDTIILEQP
jgi:Tfp pilus assembly protein PilO